VSQGEGKRVHRLADNWGIHSSLYENGSLLSSKISASSTSCAHSTGQREEAALELYFYNARYYDPVLGRFIAPDTIVPEPGNPQALNRYAYVYNNPLQYTDPSGHWLETAWDIANIVWDIHEIRQDPGNLWNWGALVVDVGTALLPGVPAFAGVVSKGGKAAKAAVEVASHADEVVDAARLGARAEDFAKVAHIPGADTLLKKLLSTSAPILKGAEFELEFALKHADEIEEMGRVLEVIHGGNKEIDFVLKGNVFVNVKNYNWAAYSEFAVGKATTDLVEEAKSFFKYNPSAVKYVFKGSVPDSVRQALEAAGIIVEVTP
jgi:RHS repeat-associated protein